MAGELDFLDTPQIQDELDFLDEEETIPQTPQQEESSRLQRMLESAGVGAGIYGAQRGLEAGYKRFGIPLAETLAFEALGGSATPEGKKLLQESLASYGETKKFITPRDVGRVALDENLLKTLPFTEPTAARAEQAATKAKILKGEFVEDIDKRFGKIGEMERVSADIEEMVSKDLPKDLDVYPEARQTLEKVQEEGRIRSFVRDTGDPRKALLSDLEKAKQAAGFTADPTAKSKKLRNIEYGGYRREGERALEVLDPKLKEEFIKRKKFAGITKIASDISKKKFYKDIGRSALEFGDMTTVIAAERIAPGTGAIALTARKLTKHGKGAMAKVLNAPNKIAKALETNPKDKNIRKLMKKLMKGVPKSMWKSLPIIGAFATYDEAKARGLDDKQAMAYTVANEGVEVIPIIGQIKMALEAEPVGPRYGSLEEKLESGEVMTNEERKKLLNQFKKVNKLSHKRGISALIEAPSNISDMDQKDLVPLLDALKVRYSEKNIHVRSLDKLINTDNKQLERALKFKLASDPSFREMVDSFIKEEK